MLKNLRDIGANINLCSKYYFGFEGIGLMMAKALENGGATVYIIGRRVGTLERAASENSVRLSASLFLCARIFFSAFGMHICRHSSPSPKLASFSVALHPFKLTY